jgi:tRNA A37 methylthiotransferase MiaB
LAADHCGLTVSAAVTHATVSMVLSARSRTGRRQGERFSSASTTDGPVVPGLMAVISVEQGCARYRRFCAMSTVRAEA